MKKVNHTIKTNALKIALIYASVSIIWVSISDRLLYSLFIDAKTLNTVSVIKGWGFVLVTAVLLYVHTRKYLNQSIKAARRQVELERRWEFALDVAGDGLWDWRLDKEHYDYAGKWTDLLNQCGGQVGQQETWLNAIHTDDLEPFQKAVNDHIRGLTERFESEHRVTCPGHNTKWLLARGLVTERDADGRARRFRGVVIDITKQKELEHELRIAATAFDSNEAKMITDTRGC